MARQYLRFSGHDAAKRRKPHTNVRNDAAARNLRKLAVCVNELPQLARLPLHKTMQIFLSFEQTVSCETHKQMRRTVRRRYAT